MGKILELVDPQLSVNLPLLFSVCVSVCGKSVSLERLKVNKAISLGVLVFFFPTHVHKRTTLANPDTSFYIYITYIHVCICMRAHTHTYTQSLADVGYQCLQCN